MRAICQWERYFVVSEGERGVILISAWRVPARFRLGFDMVTHDMQNVMMLRWLACLSSYHARYGTILCSGYCNNTSLPPKKSKVIGHSLRRVFRARRPAHQSITDQSRAVSHHNRSPPLSLERSSLSLWLSLSLSSAFIHTYIPTLTAGESENK